MITVPSAFATAAITRAGERGRQWIDELPGLVETLCAQWDLRIDGGVMHGYLSLVIPVRRGDEACVLKVAWQDESTKDEAAALAAWAGRGAVQLLAIAPTCGAMLLERLDHTRSLQTVELGAALEIAGQLLRQLAIPAPTGFRSLASVAETLAQGLPTRWEQSGRPMSRHLLDQACDLARQLGPSTEALLVNYDLHYADVLASPRAPWLVVDPKVVCGDPAFGLAQLLWRRLEEMQTQGGLAYHFQRLVEAAEVDTARARAWTLVRCVDYWLWGLSVGLTEDPARCQQITHWLSEQH